LESYSIGFYGDFTTGENYQIKSDLLSRVNILRQHGYRYLFKDVEPLLKICDANIFNLETPLTNVIKSELEHKKTVLHWADKDIVPELLQKYNVHAVSLGNNHAMDYGRQGLEQTLNALLPLNIYPFGAGLDIKSAQRPFIKHINLDMRQVNLYVFGGYKYREDYDKEFNYYADENKEGVFCLTPDSIGQTIREIKEHDQNSIIVMFPHFGFDLLKTTPMQKEYAHAFIDAGADFVIGHGPHMMNSMEIYKNKTILYGIGNFIFPADFQGKPLPYNLAVQLEFTNNGENLYLYPTYCDNQNPAVTTRPVSKEELPEVLGLLTENNQTLKDKLNAETINGLIRIEV